MVLGARDQQGKGLVLLYESDDLNTLKYKNRITTEVPFGYMWECPDLFELNGEWYLTCCPQGVEQNGLDYANVHQSCWMKIDADFDNNRFEVKEIHQLDRGTDFYAQQSFVDEKGRRCGLYKSNSGSSMAACINTSKRTCCEEWQSMPETNR